MDNLRTTIFANIEKFDGISFTLWKMKIQLAFMQYKVWRLVKESEPKPEDLKSSPQVIA